MNTPRFEFAELLNLLRRSEDDPEVGNYFGGQMLNIKRDEFYGWLKFQPEGVEVVFQEAPWVIPSEKITNPKELYLAAFHLYSKGYEGYGGYSNRLPNGVAFDDSVDQVLSKMGQPTTRGGGNMSRLLNKRIPHWFRYAFGDAILRFEFDEYGRVNIATLSVPEITPESLHTKAPPHK